MPSARRTTMRTIAAAAVLLITACGGGAVIDTPTTPEDPQPVTTSSAPVPSIAGDPSAGPADELAAARARWDAAALDTYSFRFVDDCGECMPQPDGIAVVWDGEVAAANELTISIESAFDLIASALADGTSVEVTYDRELGYPRDLWIDREARAYDGGIHIGFSEVEPGLPGEPASLASLHEAAERWRTAGIESYEFQSSLICDCDYAATHSTRVVDGRVTSFEVLPAGADVTVPPVTIDQMLTDLEELFSGVEVIEGYDVTGSARYDPVDGHPVWVGIDIDVVDPETIGDAPPLPSRLIMTVDDFVRLEGGADADLAAARARWAEAGLTDYSYDVVFHDVESADYTDPYTVRVERGAIVSVVQNGSDAGSGEVAIPTIDELFELIETARLDGADVDALYDAETGHPSLVVVSRSDGSSEVVSVHDLG